MHHLQSDNTQFRPAQPSDHPSLLDIWESSVRASHCFLSDQDIQDLLPIVRDQALPNLEVWVLCDDTHTPIGFMGLDGHKLEALFVSPAHFRRGYGQLLLKHGKQLKGALLVDVNEQNPDALAFYRANQFRISGRSPIDGQGRPFPILHLEDSSASSDL